MEENMTNTTEQKTEVVDNENLTSESTNEDVQQTESTEGVEDIEQTVEERLQAAQDEIAKLNDQLLRQMAEFDNYRKRTLKEKTELILNGGEKVITALLPVMDDLDRARLNMDQTNEIATLKEGVELIIQKLTKTLSTMGLRRIETEGQAFDTDFHEAIAMVPGDESMKNQIIDCVQPGYILNEKVIRHAKVAVGQ